MTLDAEPRGHPAILPGLLCALLALAAAPGALAQSESPFADEDPFENDTDPFTDAEDPLASYEEAADDAAAAALGDGGEDDRDASEPEPSDDPAPEADGKLLPGFTWIAALSAAGLAVTAGRRRS